MQLHTEQTPNLLLSQSRHVSRLVETIEDDARPIRKTFLLIATVPLTALAIMEGFFCEQLHSIAFIGVVETASVAMCQGICIIVPRLQIGME